MKLVALALLIAFVLVGGQSPAPLLAAGPSLPPQANLPDIFVCPDHIPGAARCHARVVTDPGGKPGSASVVTGYGPSDFQSAYGLSLTGGTGQTIGIVDAYDDPTAEADLNTYSAQFGLPPCTTANLCFTKVNQTGGNAYPKADGGWSLEISLDVQIAHAICPLCKILLVEASSNSFANLLAAEDWATAHATVVSNSWGGSEFSGETSASYGGHFNRPTVPITVSSGDNGYGVEFPAASQYVTAVGGTSLQRASNARGWSESVWSGAGSGCSAYEVKPTWQKDAGCPRRTVADVSADANPSTGAAVYDSTPYCTVGRHAFCTTGWYQVGGTSLAAPLIAGVYALAGNGGSAYGSFPYAHTVSLYDVTSGSNGSCSGSYLCTAGTGYDGPTGLGTPNGAGGF